MSKHVKLTKLYVRSLSLYIRSMRTGSESFRKLGQNALSDALGDHPEVCVT